MTYTAQKNGSARTGRSGAALGGRHREHTKVVDAAVEVDEDEDALDLGTRRGDKGMLCRQRHQESRDCTIGAERFAK